MSACDGLQPFLNRRLNAEEISAFEQHMQTCDRCRSSVEEWNRVRSTLTAALADVIPEPNEFHAKALVRRAEEATSVPRPSIWWRAALVGGVAAAAALAILMLLPQQDTVTVDIDRAPRSVDFEVIYPKLVSPSVATAAPELLSSADRERLLVRLGRGRIGLTAKSRARVKRADPEEIQLELIQGTIGIDLPLAKNRESLSILAGAFEVKVVGTRFWVSRKEADGVEVGVERGVVQILDPRGAVRGLKAGEKLFVRHVSDLAVETVSAEDRVVLDSLMNPGAGNGAPVVAGRSGSTEEAAGAADEKFEKRDRARPRTGRRFGASHPDRDTIEQWIVDGQLDKAEQAVEHQLSSRPNDVSLLRLLAACQRKAGKSRQAVDTYQKIMNIGSPLDGNAARFKAGVISQDQLGRHNDAVRFFNTYLLQPLPLRSNTVEARVRLARSLNRLGNDEQYRAVLKTIVREHGGTEAAVKASKALEQLP